MKRFRLNVLFRLVVIAGTMAATLLLVIHTASYVAAALLAFVVGLQVHGLFRYVERTNRDLARFLHAIRYSDFSQAFTGAGRGGSFDELARAFSAVMDDFRAARADKEENYRYLQTVMQHIGVGLVAFTQDGTVSLLNTAAKRLLRVPHLKNVKALAPFSSKLVGLLLQMRSGEKALVQVLDEDELLQLVVYATEFKMRGELHTLVSIQNIGSELEEKEIEAWQKLTRVLTHEIMNSITPIASLASTMGELLEDVGTPDVGTPDGGAPPSSPAATEALGDVRTAARTIERRSQSLLGFVHAYRSLTRIPTPDFKITPLREVFDDAATLLGPQMAERHIAFATRIDPAELDVAADPELIGQVLINLLKNAAEAVEGIPDAEVRLEGRIDERGRVVIQVIDNGPGIVPEAVDKIFIPFYTTKKEGSGIGLALSRQIVRQHGGTLSVVSEPDLRTVFTLRF